MALCSVSGKLVDLSGNPIGSVTVKARLPVPVLVSPNFIMPDEITATTSTVDGSFTLTLQQSVQVLIQVQYPPTGTDPARFINYVGNVPAASTANLTDIVVVE